MTTMPPRLRARRGEVALALFPNSDLRTVKTRPVLIVQADNLRTGLPQIIVAMITSNTRRIGHPSRIAIAATTPEGQQSGLLTDSIVMTDNLATIAEVMIHRTIGTITMDNIDMALRRTLHL